jgi:hypothetical protein
MKNSVTTFGSIWEPEFSRIYLNTSPSDHLPRYGRSDESAPNHQ